MRCTSEHPILVLRKKTLSKKDWVKLEGSGFKRAEYWTEMVKAKDIKLGDRVVTVRGFDNNQQNEVNGDWAEVLGLFIGDGCIGHRKGKPEYLSFCIPKEDRIREHSVALLTKYFGSPPKENDSSLIYYTPEFLDKFKDYDKYANKKYIPEEVWGWPEDAQIRFVLGYLYSDGCIVKAPSSGGGHIATHQYKCGSERLMQELKVLLTMLGFLRKRG